jgi:hypothetical protein
MKVLVNLANRVKNLSVDDLIHELSEYPDFTDLIIELNTKNQLYDKGVNSKNELLGEYSPFTKQLKQEKGQITDHVTLNDTGAFYNSFSVFLRGRDLIISADVVKDTSDLITDWGKEILGLSEESLVLLREKAKQILIPYVKQILLNNR